MEFLKAKLQDEYNRSNANKKTKVILYDEGAVQPNQHVAIIPHFQLSEHSYPATHAKALMEACISEVLSSYEKTRKELPQELQHVLDLLVEGVGFLTSSEGWKTGWYIEKERQHLETLVENFFDDKPIDLHLDTTNRLSLIKEPLICEEDKYFVIPNTYSHSRLYFVLVLPESKQPLQTAFACSVRNLLQTVVNHRKQQSFQNADKIDYFKGQTDDYIHEEHLFLLQGFCRTLCYFINSYSWREQKLSSFDLMEVRLKLPIRI